MQTDSYICHWDPIIGTFVTGHFEDFTTILVKVIKHERDVIYNASFVQKGLKWEYHFVGLP